ncbi:PREDICTED: uncharacterized protein LOC105362870 [Ceratosolen solmsi marchali]|uniref:Uncharacterized protein LOC105362870 n=1 Tax=Ceratosolen solmsi marchali TaxID=326594 RepID=A0AAJ6YIJ2_9HYME|nr:PREDICTED: uncharacterized protein LOC105362870 [Ceratosolen solmsi marchali]
MSFSRMLPLLLLFLFLLFARARADIEDHFKNCRVEAAGFDGCVREALNAIRPYFKTGLPKYNVAPFDPFFANEISARRGLPKLGFTITLRNVTESGWSASKVTKFVSDLKNYKVVYTQSFPEKYLSGDYEFNGAVLGTNVNNKGKFTLSLFDLMQTTTITREPGMKIKVRVEVETIRDLKLHISNLLHGREVLEGILDRIINGAWQPGFTFTKPLINELVSTAFTEIFDKAFRNFPFEKIIRTKQNNTL